MIYRLLGGAEDDIDRILARSAAEWGFSAAERYHRLMLTVFAVLADDPTHIASQAVSGVPGVRAYPFRLARHLAAPEDRVRDPRHLVIYRIGADGVVEIMGRAHDKMLLDRAARRMRRAAGQS